MTAQSSSGKAQLHLSARFEDLRSGRTLARRAMDVYPPVDIGTDFLGYRIEEVIGRGGMGVVYRAYDLRLKRPVALKLIAPSLATDERFRERFARESELVMSLEHPNVVPIYDAGDVDGRFYLAMRLVDGTDLGSLLRSEGALAPDRAVTICAQIASALDAAHARGLVHRDVKPSNVLLDSSEHVYLADFGLTRRLDDQAVEPDSERSIGTPAYLAPEQLEGQPLDGRADAYSLGCLLYECLTGEAVFLRGSRLAVAWAHLEEEPPRASRRRPGLPDAIDGVILRAMAKETDQRYPTCGALISAAEDAFGFGRPTPLHRRKAVLLVVAMVLIALVAATVAAVLATGGHGKAAAAPLFARVESLARIDPATNEVSAVIDVGAHPVAAAAGGHSIWVYSRDSGTISEVDAGTNRVLKETAISGFTPARCCSLFAGPVLAADASGAWFVNGGIYGDLRPTYELVGGGSVTIVKGGAYDKPRLTHVLAGGGRKREYPLDLTPTGVAAGEDAVWVVGHRGRDYQVVRIDPATGRVRARTRFPASSPVDSIAFGYGAVWVVSSPTATLYRIDPRSARTTGSLDIGSSRAARPEIMSGGHDIWVKLTGRGQVSVDPSTLMSSFGPQTSPAGLGEDRGELGALWWYDGPSGAVYRQEDAIGNPDIRTIRVTESQWSVGGPCLTSMTIGSGSLWVTAAAGGEACVP
jgi:Protein kinase domain